MNIPSVKHWSCYQLKKLVSGVCCAHTFILTVDGLQHFREFKCKQVLCFFSSASGGRSAWSRSLPRHTCPHQMDLWVWWTGLYSKYVRCSSTVKRYEELLLYSPPSVTYTCFEDNSSRLNWHNAPMLADLILSTVSHSDQSHSDVKSTHSLSSYFLLM